MEIIGTHYIEKWVAKKEKTSLLIKILLSSIEYMLEQLTTRKFTVCQMIESKQAKKKHQKQQKSQNDMKAVKQSDAQAR